MPEDLMKKILEASKKENNQYVSFFNDGTVQRDEKSYFDSVMTSGAFAAIGDTIYSAAKSYSKYGEFDTINMDMKLGLVYDGKYVNEDNTLKANAKPLTNVVRYYTGSIKSFMDEEQTNERDFYTYGLNRQGFMNYNDVVKQIRKEGLTFNGPVNYDEFKRAILNGEVFDVNIEANLKKEKSLTLRRK